MIVVVVVVVVLLILLLLLLLLLLPEVASVPAKAIVVLFPGPHGGGAGAEEGRGEEATEVAVGVEGLAEPAAELDLAREGEADGGGLLRDGEAARVRVPGALQA